LSRSSAKNEYPGVANVGSESCWIRNLLLELHWHVTKATLVYYDNVNVNVVYLSDNLVQHQHTKHIKMDIHFVREKVVRGHVRVLRVPSVLNILLMKEKKYKEMRVVHTYDKNKRQEHKKSVKGIRSYAILDNS